MHIFGQYHIGKVGLFCVRGKMKSFTVVKFFNTQQKLPKLKILFVHDIESLSLEDYCRI